MAIPPWQAGLAMAGLCLVLYIMARVRLARATEDWANAFFYSPSQKTKHRLRRERWQDCCWALLCCAGVLLVATAALYVRGPR